MLSLYLQQNIEVTGDDGKSYRYSAFGDDEDKNKFYILPQNPQFVMQNGKPVFRFIKYVTDAQDEKDLGGALATFAVNLPMPTGDVRDKVRLEVVKADGQMMTRIKQRGLDTLEMVKAKVDRQDDAEYNRLRQMLGYSEARGNSLVAKYENDKTTNFEEAPDNVKLSEVLFTDASVKVTVAGAGDDKNDPFSLTVDSPASPNKLCDHGVAVSVKMPDKYGAQIFEKALKTGENSIVRIDYVAKFEARLPPASVVVKFDSSEVANYSFEKEKNVWGKTKAINKRKELFASENSLVQVKMGSVVGMSKEEQSKLEKELREWGTSQLQTMLDKKINMDMANIGEGHADVDKYTESLKNVSSFTRELTMGRSIIFENTFSMILPTVGSIVPEADLPQYFEAITLNDLFFEKQKVAVSSICDWDEINISSVEVKLYYGTDMVNITDSSSVTPQQLANLTMRELRLTKNKFDDIAKWNKEATSDQKAIHSYLYSYQVNFTDGSDPFVSDLVYTPQDPTLEINPTNHVLVMAVDGSKYIDWDLVKVLKVDFEYKPANEKFTLTLTEKGNGAKAEGSWLQRRIVPIQAKRSNQPILYQRTFTLKDGRTIADGAQQSLANQSGARINFDIDDPFGAKKTYRFLPKFTGKVDRLLVDLTYTIPDILGAGTKFEMKKSVDWSKNSTDLSWELPEGISNGRLTYKGSMIDDGNPVAISGDDGGRSFVSIGPANVEALTVTAAGSSFNRLNNVTVNFKENGTEDNATFVSANQKPKMWYFQTGNGNTSQYQVKVDHKDFDNPVDLGWQTLTDSDEVLLALYDSKDELLRLLKQFELTIDGKAFIDWSKTKEVLVQIETNGKLERLKLKKGANQETRKLSLDAKGKKAFQYSYLKVLKENDDDGNAKRVRVPAENGKWLQGNASTVYLDEDTVNDWDW
ncbi:MAG: hypothetical protein AAF490_19730 [Chloroflexota bacterium]